jgi:hypothetical protein
MGDTLARPGEPAEPSVGATDVGDDGGGAAEDVRIHAGAAPVGARFMDC